MWDPCSTADLLQAIDSPLQEGTEDWERASIDGRR